MFVIQGAKRGAIIAASIGLLMYFYYQIKTIENKRRILGFISVIIVIMILSVFAYITSMSNDFMLNRMTSMVEGDTSNRSILYAMIFEKWYASDNILNLLFGYGLAGSLVLTDGWGLAHNDWLELLSNFGLTGIFTYIFLFYSAVKTSLTKEWMSDKRILMLTLVFMWFFITLVSMWYNALEYFANAILFGYLVGNKNLNLE
jgi:O-antigen ligase